MAAALVPTRPTDKGWGSPDYRQRDGHVADEMRAMASPTQVAETLAARFSNQQ